LRIGIDDMDLSNQHCFWQNSIFFLALLNCNVTRCL